MIEKRTVLILGAGSSYEVGFPLGRQLINEIYTLVMGSSKGYRKNIGGNIKEETVPNAALLNRFLEVAGEKRQDGSDYSVDFIRTFAEELWNAKLPSIDDFLFHREEFSLIGKISILFVLSNYENAERFKPQLQFNNQWDYPAWGWYEQHLWPCLVDGTNRDFTKLKQNKLSIITFNYDRSLEHFLITAIKAAYGLNETEAAEFFSAIPVEHVYGKLGKLNWEMVCLGDLPQAREDWMLEGHIFTPWEIRVLFRLFGAVGEYGMTREDWDTGRTALSENARQQIVKVFVSRAKDIKTYHEVSEQSKYRDILQQAERIYFLGCSYHEQNLKALGLLDGGESERGLLCEGIEVFGTAVGLTEAEKALKQGFVASFSNSKVQISNNWLELKDNESSKITSFLRNVAPLNLFYGKNEAVSSI